MFENCAFPCFVFFPCIYVDETMNTCCLCAYGFLCVSECVFVGAYAGGLHRGLFIVDAQVEFY